jgi:AraC family transcriptional regulator
MICSRCIIVVTEILKKQSIGYEDVELGFVSLNYELDQRQLEKLNKSLINVGLGLIREKDKKNLTISKIKEEIIKSIFFTKTKTLKKYSVILTNKTGRNYSYLARMFKQEEGITITDYIIAMKIERAKELLSYGDMTMQQISAELRFHNHTSFFTCFKRIEKITPVAYKKNNDKERKPLDALILGVI